MSRSVKPGASLPIVAPDAETRPPAADSGSRPVPLGDAPVDLRDVDLLALLTDFYERVEADELLAPYFASVDMAAHMPRIVDFWSTLVFQTKRYTGNAFRPHLDMPGLTAAHFARWLQVMEATVDAHAAGPAAERMKAYAHRVAHSMQVRMGIQG